MKKVEEEGVAAVAVGVLDRVVDEEGIVDDDDDKDVFLISTTCGFDNAASCCLDVRTGKGSLDTSNGSSFRQCGYGCVEQGGH
jgi:hypothetical protein